MKRVTYTRTETAVFLNAAGVTLIYGGKPYKHDRGPWSIGADAFEGLKAENPDVDFVDESSE